MPRPITVNELRQLEDSNYGKPWPRHGIMLLYWFCNDYVSFDDDGDLVAEYDPQKNMFSFHPFHDDAEGNGQLLPDVGLPFYEVGNLNKPSAANLPLYVKENHTDHGHGESNTDRIIISVMDGLVIDKVYITVHVAHLGRFDPAQTYCITRGLIKIIRGLNLEELKEMTGY